MTTSGSTSFSVTRDDILRGAFHILGAIGLGEQPSAEEMSRAAFQLNMLVKYWQSKGMNRWTDTEAILFPDYGVAQFLLGAGSSTHCTNTASLVTTTLASATSIGGNVLHVASAVGITSGMHIGIPQSATQIFWTTVNGAPIGYDVLLLDAAPYQLDAGATVYAYASPITRPVRISEARRRISSVDTPLMVSTRADYMSLPLKTSLGLPNQIFYDPQIGQGRLNVWPTNSDVRNTIVFSYNRSIQDFIGTTDNPDYPQEWYRALTYGLANDLCAPYGITGDLKRDIQLEAVQSFNDLSGFDTDIAVYIQPAIRTHGV